MRISAFKGLKINFYINPLGLNLDKKSLGETTIQIWAKLLLKSEKVEESCYKKLD